MLFGIFESDCDDVIVNGYTEDLDEAYKYCAVNSGCEIRSLDKLKSDINYENYEFVYRYIITFEETINGTGYRRDNFPDYMPECDYCKCYIKKINLYNKVSYFPRWKSDKEIIAFEIFIKERNINLAYSVANKFLENLLSRGNGKITKENVKAMNDEFSKEYREEQERIKAEIERKNKTRALEGKIRKLEFDIKNKESDLQKLREEYEKELGSK